jgi:uncharacterized protein (DUF934 family)
MATPDVHLGPGSHRILRLRPDDGVAEITVDHWLRLADDAPYPQLDALPILVSLARIEGEREQLESRTGPFGAWLRGDADPEQVAPILAGLPLVAIEVPKFTDGRHYSLARLLRERYGFAGELRVFGDVQPDQLFYMRRCGYTSFDLKPGKSLETGLRTLEAFSVTYQAAADEAPLYRRRHY